jgi:hypothetical protein
LSRHCLDICYLDESGDLGFEFDNRSPSSHFIITLLVCDDQESAKAIKKAVEKTIKNKIQAKKCDNHELKGTRSSLSIKEYFFKNAAKNNAWKIYSIILDKKLLLRKLAVPIDKHRIYNVLANHVLKQLDFSSVQTINLFVDRSKNRDGINEFDDMLRVTMDTILPLSVPFNISHIRSHESYGIQAVDIFCWGVFRKYVHHDEEWYDLFQSKVVYEQRFLA